MTYLTTTFIQVTHIIKRSNYAKYASDLECIYLAGTVIPKTRNVVYTEVLRQLYYSIHYFISLIKDELHMFAFAYEFISTRGATATGIPLVTIIFKSR